jgi:type IX secretion system PorP/SprF family membrane protein
MKNFKLYRVVLGLGMLFSTSLHAQQEQMYSHYDYNSLAINPAYAGSKRTFVANSLARMQWNSLPGAPRYYNLGMHTPLVGDFAGGLNIQTGKIGKFKVASPLTETQIALSGAYNKQIANNVRVAVGLRFGLYNYVANLSQLQLDKPGDQVFNNNDYNLTAPMAGFGVYVYGDNYFAGVSAPRMVFVPADQRANNVNVAYAATTQYYAVAGYVIDAGPDWKVKPTTQIKIANGVPVEADFNLHAIYMDDFSLGAFVRTGGEGGVMAMANVSPNFTILYSYDTRWAPLNQYVRSSHEFGIQYMIPYVSNSRVKAPRYF